MSMFLIGGLTLVPKSPGATPGTGRATWRKGRLVVAPDGAAVNVGSTEMSQSHRSLSDLGVEVPARASSSLEPVSTNDIIRLALF